MTNYLRQEIHRRRAEMGDYDHLDMVHPEVDMAAVDAIASAADSLQDVGEPQDDEEPGDSQTSTVAQPATSDEDPGEDLTSNWDEDGANASCGPGCSPCRRPDASEEEEENTRRNSTEVPLTEDTAPKSELPAEVSQEGDDSATTRRVGV